HEDIVLTQSENRQTRGRRAADVGPDTGIARRQCSQRAGTPYRHASASGQSKSGLLCERYFADAVVALIHNKQIAGDIDRRSRRKTERSRRCSTAIARKSLRCTTCDRSDGESSRLHFTNSIVVLICKKDVTGSVYTQASWTT